MVRVPISRTINHYNSYNSEQDWEGGRDRSLASATKE